MTDVLFVNHIKSQCGIYELGKRIFGLIDQNEIACNYIEVPVGSNQEYIEAMEKYRPSYVIYNYYVSTMPFVHSGILRNYPSAKHMAILHDPLDPGTVSFVESTFDAWIIHDHTNPLPSLKKFTTFRPIPRFERKNQTSDRISIGSHGFPMNPWKAFDRILHIVQDEFDEIDINMNIPVATFSMGEAELYRLEQWKNIIHKQNINLNITSHYFPEESGLIDFLSKNTINIYFYNPPGEYVGVGASGDLAVASQSSLIVNNTYMYRHFHEKLGYYEQTNRISDFLNNSDKVKELYNEWSPEAITYDYKKMIERV